LELAHGEVNRDPWLVPRACQTGGPQLAFDVARYSSWRRAP
jgi:hypothetical protein